MFNIIFSFASYTVNMACSLDSQQNSWQTQQSEGSIATGELSVESH